jgi:hypothetical protein
MGERSLRRLLILGADSVVINRHSPSGVLSDVKIA